MSYNKDKQILKENWQLYLIAEIFIEQYPEDIFTDNPTSIVKIGKGFKEILEIRDNAKKGMLVESEM